MSGSLTASLFLYRSPISTHVFCSFLTQDIVDTSFRKHLCLELDLLQCHNDCWSPKLLAETAQTRFPLLTLFLGSIPRHRALPVPFRLCYEQNNHAKRQYFLLSPFPPPW